MESARITFVKQQFIHRISTIRREEEKGNSKGEGERRGSPYFEKYIKRKSTAEDF